MSYCRFGTPNSDVYCYGDGTHWITHVALYKNVRLPRDWHKGNLEDISGEKIGLPYDGETFSEPTLEKFRARLLWLRRAGYRVPDSALDRIAREIAEQGRAT